MVTMDQRIEQRLSREFGWFSSRRPVNKGVASPRFFLVFTQARELFAAAWSPASLSRCSERRFSDVDI